MRLTRLLRFCSGGPPKNDPPQDWRFRVSGLKWAEMKKHYSIIPIMMMSVFSIGMAGSYVVRLATQHPEVHWTKKTAEPWNEYRNKQYKFLDSGRDYTKPSPAPPYK